MLENLDEALDFSVREQLATEVLRDVVADSETSTVQLKSLTSKPVTVSVGVDSEPTVGFITHDDVKKMKIKHSLSDR